MANARLNLTGNLAKQVVVQAKALGTGLVLEDLKFSDDREVTAKFSRMSHSFCYSSLLVMITRRAKRGESKFGWYTRPILQSSAD